jgi:glutathione S-transferase
VSDTKKFVLRSTLTSPFGRKVRMAIDVLGLGERISVEPANPLDENDTLRQQNALGKMPCLVLSDGTSIYDSGVIIEYLQELAGSEQLLPAHGPARYQAMTRARLADGIMDASILMIYDSRFRPGAPPRRNGWRISAARSIAGLPPLRRRRLIRTTPTSSR